MEIHTDCVVRGTIYTWYCKWRVPRLFQWADDGQWDKIPKRCRMRPKEVLFVHKYAPADTALHRLLRTLHYSCCSEDCPPPDEAHKKRDMTDIPEEEGSRMASASSTARTVDGSDRQTDTMKMAATTEPQQDPAGMEELLLNAVQAMLQANPQVAFVPNMFGRTPLHLACSGELTQSRTRAAILMLECTPRVASLTDKKEKQTALHKAALAVTAAARGARDEQRLWQDLVQAFQRADPDALERHDVLGRTPMDLIGSSL